MKRNVLRTVRESLGCLMVSAVSLALWSAGRAQAEAGVASNGAAAAAAQEAEVRAARAVKDATRPWRCGWPVNCSGPRRPCAVPICA